MEQIAGTDNVASPAEFIDEMPVNKRAISGWRFFRSGRPVSGRVLKLCATAELLAERGHAEQFVRDFVKAWIKVINADWFDLTTRSPDHVEHIA